jgi:hypothetical protein
MHGLPPFAPATHPFADGLERDHAAVLAGLTLPAHLALSRAKC